jgi:hypothetical protein
MTVNSVIDNFQLTRSLFQQPAKAKKNAKHNPRIDSLKLACSERFQLQTVEMRILFSGIAALHVVLPSLPPATDERWTPLFRPNCKTAARAP